MGAFRSPRKGLFEFRSEGITAAWHIDIEVHDVPKPQRCHGSNGLRVKGLM